MLKHLHSWLAVQPLWLVTLLCGGLTAIVGLLDDTTGSHISFSLFYLGPIALAAWYTGRNAGTGIATLATLLWLAADYHTHLDAVSGWIPIWNTLVRLGFFLIFVWLLCLLKSKLELEESLADTDPLTGLANRRAFNERLDAETARTRRYKQAFTIAYIDLDNFKYVNDNMGHDVGDQVLLKVGHTIKSGVRTSDIAARFGGDEFACLFPITNHQDAQPVLENLHRRLLQAMQDQQWPITFSIGAITYEALMDNTRDMIKAVDDLMYTVKKSGKNSITHKTWQGKMH